MSTNLVEADLSYFKSATVIFLLQCFGSGIFLIEIFNAKSAVTEQSQRKEWAYAFLILLIFEKEQQSKQFMV